MASKGFKQRQTMRDAMYGAFGMLGADAIGNQFRGLQGLYSPFFNQMAASQGLAGQAQANAVGAQMGRMGLGGTGLGAALGAGLQAGSAFQGNQIRAKMFQDLLNQATQIQGQKANMMFNQGMASAGTFKDWTDYAQQIAQMGQGVAGAYYGGGGGTAGGFLGINDLFGGV